MKMQFFQRSTPAPVVVRIMQFFPNQFRASRGSPVKLTITVKKTAVVQTSRFGIQAGRQSTSLPILKSYNKYKNQKYLK